MPWESPAANYNTFSTAVSGSSAVVSVGVAIEYRYTTAAAPAAGIIAFLIAIAAFTAIYTDKSTSLDGNVAVGNNFNRAACAAAAGY